MNLSRSHLIYYVMIIIIPYTCDVFNFNLFIIGNGQRFIVDILTFGTLLLFHFLSWLPAYLFLYNWKNILFFQCHENDQIQINVIMMQNYKLHDFVHEVNK